MTKRSVEQWETDKGRVLVERIKPRKYNVPCCEINDDEAKELIAALQEALSTEEPLPL